MPLNVLRFESGNPAEIPVVDYELTSVGTISGPVPFESSTASLSGEKSMARFRFSRTPRGITRHPDPEGTFACVQEDPGGELLASAVFVVLTAAVIAAMV